MVPLDGARLAVVLRNLDFVPAVDAEELLTAMQAQGLTTFPTLDDGAIAVAACSAALPTPATVSMRPNEEN